MSPGRAGRPPVLPGESASGRVACKVTAFAPPGCVVQGRLERRVSMCLEWSTERYPWTRGRVEAHLPTPRPEAGEKPWFSAPDVDTGRPGDHSCPPLEGPAPSVGVAAPRDVQIRRVRDRATFEALRRRAQRARSGPVTVSFLSCEGEAEARVGYAVGRRVGGAVLRNRVRRRLRAIVGELAPNLRPGAYLVAVSAQAATLPYGRLRQAVDRAVTSVHDGSRS
jgi:ribonuclease P protein component